jgi:hypothetical protein
MRRAAILAVTLLALTSATALASSPYLTLAEQGITQQSAAWRSGGWYCEVLGCKGAYPLLTIWGMVRMFESVDAVQIAAPSRVHRAAVERLAGQAQQLYWNRYLQGYDPYPNDDYPAAQAWFDDNGWLGLAFVDAWRATGDGRWLSAAQRALSFIARRAWDGGNGMWWNTQHAQHSGEALSAASLLAMTLYGPTRDSGDLAHARQWIDWANTHDTGFHGLYDSQGPGSTVIDYVQAPLIYAQYLLCQASGQNSYCAIAAAKATALTQIYGVRYDLAPLYDSIFFQWMMAYGKAAGDPHWLALAQANAAAAQQHASDGRGLWLSGWWGDGIHDAQTQPGMFRTMAGTTSLYAWLAYYAG